MYKLLLTREEKDNEASKNIFDRYNIKTISLPMIETIPKNFELKSFDFYGIIFSSKKSVDIFFKNISICKNANIDIYSVGEKTKEAIKTFYNTTNIISENSIKDILPKITKKTLWIRTDFDLPKDVEPLLQNKDIFILKAYETRHKTYDEKIALDKLELADGIFFASPSAFLGLLKNLQNYKDILHKKDLFAIGATTAKAIQDHGFTITYVPEKPSVELIAIYISTIGT